MFPLVPNMADPSSDKVQPTALLTPRRGVSIDWGSALSQSTGEGQRRLSVKDFASAVDSQASLPPISPVTKMSRVPVLAKAAERAAEPAKAASSELEPAPTTATASEPEPTPTKMDVGTAERPMRGLRAAITGSQPGEKSFLFDAYGALYTVEVRGDGGRPRTSVRRRFSEFRQLHAEISARLQLSPFPAWRRIFNIASVRRERERLLPIFLNEALLKLDAPGAPSAVALSTFLGLDGAGKSAPTAASGKEVDDAAESEGQQSDELEPESEEQQHAGEPEQEEMVRLVGESDAEVVAHEEEAEAEEEEAAVVQKKSWQELPSGIVQKRGAAFAAAGAQP